MVATRSQVHWISILVQVNPLFVQTADSLYNQLQEMSRQEGQKLGKAKSVTCKNIHSANI